MQRSRARVALADIDQFNEGAHCKSPYSVEAGASPASVDALGCAADTAATQVVAAGADGRPGSSTLATAKIKYAKQSRVVSPQSGEIKSSPASQRDETFRRVFVRMLGQDFFTSMEIKLSIL